MRSQTKSEQFQHLEDENEAKLLSIEFYSTKPTSAESTYGIESTEIQQANVSILICPDCTLERVGVY